MKFLAFGHEIPCATLFSKVKISRNPSSELSQLSVTFLNISVVHKGFEQLRKSKGSLEAFLQNVNIGV